MKKTAFIIGTVFASTALMGSLFKVMHWPGAGIMLVVGVVGFALIGLPMIAMYRYNKA